MTNPWKTLTSKLIYENPWISVREDQVINPGGGEGIYGKVHFKNIAVGVIPIDSEGYTYLVGQYRYPLGAYSWEIPEGGCPEGEKPLEAAKRELREETGIKATDYEHLLKMHLSNSVSDEVGYVFLATGLLFGDTEFEETEQLEIKKVKLSRAMEMVMSGEITDSLSVAGLLKVQLLINQADLKIPH